MSVTVGGRPPVRALPSPEVRAIPMPARGERAQGWATRSVIYDAAAAGKVRLIKVGRRTMVDAADLSALYESLPRAEIGGPRRIGIRKS